MKTKSLKDCCQYTCLFSEKLITEMADRMAEDGFRDAGYEYVSIDVSTFCPLCNLLHATVK